MAEKVINPFTDVEYENPPEQEIAETVEATSGTVGGASVSRTGTESGQPSSSNKIGMSTQKNEEKFYVGSLIDALIILGQLRQKTGADEYGIWIGNATENLKYSVASGLRLFGSGIEIQDGAANNAFKVIVDGVDRGDVIIGEESSGKFIKWDASLSTMIIQGILEAGEVHIPDQTTANSFHIASNGDMWLGCNVADWNASHDNATAYILSTGNAVLNNATIRGVLKSSVFQKDIISAVGGVLMVANAGTLDADMTALDASTLTIKSDTSFVLNQMLRIKDGVDEEWFRVTDITGAPTYVVTRDLAGSYAADSNPAWKKGAAVVAQGVSDGAASYSGGWLSLFGEGTNSPYYSVYARTGVNYNDYEERVRLGNLNGIAGIAVDAYGIFIGDYTAGQYLMYDDVSGKLIVNRSELSNEDKFGDGSDGDVEITANTSLTSDMFYNTLTVKAGWTLNTKGYRIFVKETMTVESGAYVIRNGNNGGNAGNGGNTPAGAGGTAGAAASALSSGSLYGSLAGTAGTVGGAGSEITAGGGGSSGPFNGSSNNGTDIVKGLGSSASTGVAGANGGSTGGGGNIPRGTGGAAGTAGALSGTVYNVPKSFVAAYFLIDSLPAFDILRSQPSAGGSGSGGGGGASAFAFPDRARGGGGGGSAGTGSSAGIMAIFAKVIINEGVISANGGDGGDGGDGGNGGPYPAFNGAGGGGGGGSGGDGGSGGIIIMLYCSLTGAGAITVTGGVGGSKGLGGTGTATAGYTANDGDDGNDGAAGQTGTIIELKS